MSETIPASSPPQSHASRFRWLVRLLVTGLLSGGGVWWWLNPGLPSGISREDYRAAELEFQKQYGLKASRMDALSLLAEMAVRDERLETAAACFVAIPTEDRRYGLSARLQAGQVLARLNRAVEAERHLREFLSLATSEATASPDQIRTARNWLVFLLSVQLRFEERREHLVALHRDGQADEYDSKMYFFPGLLTWNSVAGRARLAEFLKQNPDDVHLRTAQARYLTAEGRMEDAVEQLRGLLQKSPSDRAVQAAMLESYLERDDQPGFEQFLTSLPEFAEDEPLLLTRMRVEFALHRGDSAAALVLLKHLQRRDPTHPVDHMRLAQALELAGRQQEREAVQQRSLILARIRLNLVNLRDDHYEAAKELASACDELELPEAAETFRRHASRMQQSQAAPDAASRNRFRPEQPGRMLE